MRETTKRILKNANRLRTYASHWEWRNKGIKERGIDLTLENKEGVEE